jgi:hypothetical protein
VPFPALDTQKGLPAETEIPQVPTRLGSTTAAVPAVSAIRSVRTKFVAANAGADNSAVAKTPMPQIQFFKVLIFTSPGDMFFLD